MAKVPLDLLRVPPPPSELAEDRENPLPIGELSGMRPLVNFPEWTDLSDGYFPEVEQRDWSHDKPNLHWQDLFELAVDMLAAEDWIAWPTNDLVRLLYGELFPREHPPTG
jgi:hypothetical protein